MSTTGPMAGVTALVCDDEGMTILALRRALEHAGATIVGLARNGEEAVEIADRERPDLILMEIRMPVLDGIEATRRILSIYSPCIIAVSTIRSEGEEERVLQAGAHGVVFKPFSSEQVVSYVEQVLETICKLLPQKQPSGRVTTT